MKTLITSLAILILIGLISSCGSHEDHTALNADHTAEVTHKAPQQIFDSLLAKEYGADSYGMRKYVMAFLKAGPNRNLDSAKTYEVQAAHMKNIERMADEGKLVVAGPFFDDGDLRGIYIFNVTSIEEAEALTNTDPAIQEGVLVMELKEWYCTAALMAIPELHKTLSKTPM